MTFVRNILNDVIKLGCKEHWLWVMLVSFTLNHTHLFSPGVAMTGGKKDIAISLAVRALCNTTSVNEVQWYII